MEAVLNPFRANLLAVGDRMLQSHRTVTDWQINQMKMAEKQMADWMAFSRAAMDAMALSVALATKGTVREARGFTSST